MKTVGVSDYANLVSPSGTVPRPTFGGGDAGNKHRGNHMIFKSTGCLL